MRKLSRYLTMQLNLLGITTIKQDQDSLKKVNEHRKITTKVRFSGQLHPTTCRISDFSVRIA